MPKILIIDDEERMRTLYSAFLSKEGYDVVTASNGGDGIALAKSEKPDLVLLDVMMPAVDGAEVFQHLHKAGIAGKVPIVFFTALVNEEEMKENDGMIGGQAYISKSAPKDEFLKSIAKFLKKR